MQTFSSPKEMVSIAEAERLHSEVDLRCPISQAEQLFVVLKQRRKDVEFVRFPDEDHELSRAGRPSHRVDRFNVILDYWSRKL